MIWKSTFPVVVLSRHRTATVLQRGCNEEAITTTLSSQAVARYPAQQES